MASHESNENSVKSPAANKINAQSKTDVKEPSTVSSVKQRNEPNNAVNTEEKKSLTSDVSNESANVEEKDGDKVENESKHDSHSLATVKKQLDDSEINKKQEAQDMDTKQEIPNADSQNTDEEQDIKNEDNKDLSSKVGKRKRKSVRLV